MDRRRKIIRIDVYADVVCPWCYIGEKRLEKALAMHPDIAVERRWRPFQLRPEMPAVGLPWAEFAREKFGGGENAQSAFDQITRLGAEEGIRFDFGRVASAPNTVDAHRLILLGAHHNLQQEMSDALFHAYFAEGANLNDHEDLVPVAAGSGLDAKEVRNLLADANFKVEVWHAQEEAARLGATGVPFYVFGGRYGLSGAQPIEVFLKSLDTVCEKAVIK